MYRVDIRPPVLADEPPAREGWPRAARWALGIFLAVTVGFIAATAGTAVVIFQQYPAHVAAPDSVLGLTKSADLTRAMLGSATPKEAFLRAHPGFAQAYSDKDGSKIALVLAGEGFSLRPARELVHELSRWNLPVFELGEITDVPPGDLGGSAACMNAKLDDDAFTFCGWADHGNIGIAVLMGPEDRAEAARWMLDIREAVVTR